MQQAGKYTYGNFKLSRDVIALNGLKSHRGIHFVVVSLLAAVYKCTLSTQYCDVSMTSINHSYVLLLGNKILDRNETNLSLMGLRRRGGIMDVLSIIDKNTMETPLKDC
jgi:hypothetical protein